MPAGIELALVRGMNSKSLWLAGLALAAGASVFFAPSLQGQAAGDEAALAALVGAVTAQQVVLAENQAKIDARIASLAENIRIARIYAGRSR